ncbi:MAG TPA: 2OG-Fe(II) oxygenase [Steroidobacteraceae bacterium]|nr:2OG-Fe(II) oxygenase [Steroidobacteraceae bacterium]
MNARPPHPELARAAQFDAAGNFDEAINCLARGTGAGDAACTEQLGMRLLTGQNAPLLPAEGLQFIGEACARGFGEGAARAAGVIAMGTGGVADWRRALDWLCRSAEAGWSNAQRQLRALADDRELARHSADWRALAATIDLESWRRAPAPQVRSEDPRVVAFSGLARPELCEFFISLAPGRLEPARVYDPVQRADIVVAHRSNTLANFDLRRVELAHVLLQARMSAACGMPERHMEAPAVLHYAPGEQIADHFDFVDPASVPDYAAEIARNGQRLVTFLLYLNDDYDGGETAFPKLGFSHRGRTGDGLYFINALPDMQPDVRTLHAGCPTTRGEKWIITQFIRSRPTR